GFSVDRRLRSGRFRVRGDRRVARGACLHDDDRVRRHHGDAWLSLGELMRMTAVCEDGELAVLEDDAVAVSVLGPFHGRVLDVERSVLVDAPLVLMAELLVRVALSLLDAARALDLDALADAGDREARVLAALKLREHVGAWLDRHHEPGRVRL